MRKSTKVAALISAAAFGLFGAHKATADIITQWAFTGTTAAPDNSPSPTTGIGTSVSLGMTNSYTYAGGEGPGSTTNDDITQPDTPQSTESAWRIRGNSNTKNAGLGKANGWNNSAPNYTQGAEFEVPTTGLIPATLSFDWYCTGSGVANMQVRYTLDDTAGSPVWVNLGSDYVNTAGNFYGGTASTAASTPNISIDLTSITGAANDANFAFEMVSVMPVAGDADYFATGPGHDGDYASGTTTVTTPTDYNNSSGNWSFNNITLSTAVVPEPTSMAALGLAGAALLNRRRRKA